MTHIRLLAISLSVLLVVSLGASLCQAATINVSAGHSIQTAINSAADGDTVVVAAGKYYEHINFGAKNITVRSSNPLSASVVQTTIIDASQATEVVKFSRPLSAGPLSGFTITHGQTGVYCDYNTSATISHNIITANSVRGIRMDSGNCNPLIDSNTVSSNSGNGIESYGGSTPTIVGNLINNNTGRGIAAQGTSCSIEGNTLQINTHGGIYCSVTGDITGNTITNNSSSDDGGGICSSSSASINGNVITANNSNGSGGGIYCNGNASITGNVITGNISNGSGGGIRCGAAAVVNNLIADNSANGSGGGVWCGGSASMLNNTISDNQAGQNQHGGNVFINYSSPNIRNCIITFAVSGDGIYANSSGATIVAYCDVYGNVGTNYVGVLSTSGPGNISLDPLFISRVATARNYRLKSTCGHWNGSTFTADTTNSPCIDAGDPTSSYALEPTPNGNRVNMGYDGNTPQASKGGAPGVVSQSPSGLDISRSASVRIGFSVAMTKTTAQTAFKLVKTGTTTAILGAFTWVGNEMRFKPTVLLTANTGYTVTLATTAKSATGRPLPTACSWSFTVGATAPARITASAAPTASGAQIAVNLASAADVTASIRNVAGRDIALLQPGMLEAGVHSLLWNGRSTTGTKVPGGVYLVQVTAKGADGSTSSAVTSLRK